MYAQRKGWTLGTIDVSVVLASDDHGTSLVRRIAFGAPLSAEQRARLIEISEKTPVTRMLKAGMAISTVVAG